jgi:hypothetical protein
MTSATEKIPPEALVDPIWERQKGETAVAYAAFRAYRDLGEGRTIPRAVKVLLDSWPDIAQRDSRTELSEHSYTNRAAHWSATGRWVERAAAYDASLDKIRLNAEEVGAKKMARHYEARVQAIKDMEWEIGQASYRNLIALMSQPVLGEVRSQDGKTIHIHPNKEITKVLPALMREASRLIRLSQDLPTEGAKMPTPQLETGPGSDVEEFFKHLGSGTDNPALGLPDPDEAS